MISRPLCGTQQDPVMYKQAESVYGLYNIGPIFFKFFFKDLFIHYM